jgi:UMF1 family MFS transporter
LITENKTNGYQNKVVAWALYDWANSAFAVTVMVGFFPLFLKQYWSTSNDPTVSTFHLGAANSLASLVIVVLAPVLGAIADRSGAKKKYLLVFAGMGIAMTGALSLVASGNWLMAISLYVLAMIGFSGGNVFYDSLLINVAEPNRLDRVSALGFGLGYLGGGLIFGACVMMTLWPDKVGLADASQAVRVSFVIVAAWWSVFSIPLLIFVREPHVENRVSGWSAVGAGFRQIAATFQEIRRLKVVFFFLLGYWFYIDGVGTIARMAVDYALGLGLEQDGLIFALLVTQFIGFPSAIAFGILGERIGAKRGIAIGIAVYAFVTLWSYFMTEIWEFYVLAMVIGLVQGGIQSLSRSLYARIIPADKAGEFFGFYNMLGKFAAVLGPLLMGIVGLLTGSPRLAILVVLALFLVGALFLYMVDEEAGKRRARELEGQPVSQEVHR